MSRLYLVTGATGHVGTVLIRELLKRGERVRALARPGRAKLLPAGVEAVEGDVTDEKSLEPFFERKGDISLSLIHCAALITVASKTDPKVWDTNVTGTENVMRLAFAYGTERVIYVSSVHAIPEKPAPEIITEVNGFSPELVSGQYAKSKAAAGNIVLGYARRGLNASIVHPSGIIGPGDTEVRNHMIRSLRAMARGTIPVAVAGGYDFVDSRDVAEGILLCEEKGRPGECYILSGHYAAVSELLNTVRRIRGKRKNNIVVPYGLAKAFAGAGERAALAFGKKTPLFTPYSIEPLHTNGHFSYQKAAEELGYAPRELEISIRDSLD